MVNFGKVSGLPTQISEKLELVAKTLFGNHGNNKSADFYQDFGENQQFYPVHENLRIFIYFVYMHKIWK